jgi:predicted transcriptional regulator
VLAHRLRPVADAPTRSQERIVADAIAQVCAR